MSAPTASSSPISWARPTSSKAFCEKRWALPRWNSSRPILGPLLCSFAAALASGSQVVISIRPENIKIAKAWRTDENNILEGKVKERTCYLGMVEYAIDVRGFELRVRSAADGARSTAMEPFDCNWLRINALLSRNPKECRVDEKAALFKNRLLTLLTQERTHEAFFEKEIHGHAPEPPLPEEARRHLERWHMPEQGFRNYWYPVMLASALEKRPDQGRLLGEDIAFLARRRQGQCDRGSLPAPRRQYLRGHIRFPGSGTSVALITAGPSTGRANSALAFKKDPIRSCRRK